MSIQPLAFGYGKKSTMCHGKVWRTRHKFGGGLPLLPQPFHLSLPRPVGRHYRAVFAPAAASADRASGPHLVCSLRNRQHNGDSGSANPRLDGSGKGSAIGDSSPRRRTQTQKIRRRLRKITSLVPFQLIRAMNYVYVHKPTRTEHSPAGAAPTSAFP